MNKNANFVKVYKQLFSKEEDSGHVECRYRIIGRLISIKVLWESFYPNTPIKVKLWTSFIIIFLSFCHHSLLSFVVSYHN